MGLGVFLIIMMFVINCSPNVNIAKEKFLFTVILIISALASFISATIFMLISLKIE